MSVQCPVAVAVGEPGGVRGPRHQPPHLPPPRSIRKQLLRITQKKIYVTRVLETRVMDRYKLHKLQHCIIFEF